MPDKTCLNCNRAADLIPLISLEYRGETYAICPQCFPTLIHKPQALAGKLPGSENLAPADHAH
jgi:hypothetical protein